LKDIVKIIARKDLRVVLQDKMIWLPMLIVPLLLCALLPVILFIAAGSAESVKELESIPFEIEGASHFNPAQRSIYFAVNYMFPGLFLIIPLLTSSIIAGSSFVGEREGKTLEALFYTPVSIKELFTAKLTGSFVIAYSVTFLSFILFSTVMFAGQFFYFDSLIYPSVKWLIFIFWLCPAIILLGLIFMIRTSAKAKTFQEAQQRVLFLILPVILIIVGQIAGIFYLSTLVMIIAGLVIFIIDYLIMLAAIENFKPENLVF
jgi:ABC-2 type transport system permease protein